MGGAQLHVHSAFSFLDGASTPEALVEASAAQGIDTVALTDSHRVSGIVAFLKACRLHGIKGLVGAEVAIESDGHLVLLVPETQAYPALTELLTQAHLSSLRPYPQVSWAMLRERAGPLIVLTGDRDGVLPRAVMSRSAQQIEGVLEKLSKTFPPDHVFVEVTTSLLPGDRQLFGALRQLARQQNWGMVATGAVHYAQKSDFGLYDLMTCIRTHSWHTPQSAERLDGRPRPTHPGCWPFP